jgi:hypothetical protein
MNIEWKYMFGCIAVGGLAIIQLGAFYFGHDGAMTSFTTSSIAAIIAFLLGLNVPSPSQKIATREAVTAVINNINKGVNK